MQKKAVVLLGIAAVLLAGIAWFGLTVWSEIRNEPGGSASGPALSIDVVAPKAPEPVQSTGQLSVGELSNGYEHTATIEKTEETPSEDPEGYTTWNDDNWSNDRTPPSSDDKRVYQSEAKDKAASVTVKVPQGE